MIVIKWSECCSSWTKKLRYVNGYLTKLPSMVSLGTVKSAAEPPSVGTLNRIVARFILTMFEGSTADGLNGSGLVLSKPSLSRRNTRQAMAFCRAIAVVTIAGSKTETEGCEVTTTTTMFAVTAMLKSEVQYSVGCSPSNVRILTSSKLAQFVTTLSRYTLSSRQ